MVFFALAAASVSLHGPLWPLEKGLAQFVLIQLLILIALRGVVPTLWFGKEFGADFDRRAIWLLVPKGVLLFELVHGPGLRLPALVDGGLTRFLYQLVVADLLVYAVGFSVVATLFQRVRASRQVVSSTD